MGILSTEIEITLCSRTIKYYEDLGYEIPRSMGNKKKFVVPRGTKIFVKVNDLPKYSGVTVDAECDNCKKKYSIIYENYQKTNHNGNIYCNTCAKRIFNSGENHPLFDPTISIEEREIGRNFEGYSDFIKKVFARDKYTCYCCKKSKDEVDIQVHHLDGYNWCKEKRTDVSNGITLCKNCHMNFHSKYGKGFNTKEQFEEWLGYALQELQQYNGEIKPARKIYCYEEDKIYFSAKEFCMVHNIKSTSPVYHVCNKIKNYVSILGLHLFWYDEYINMNTEDVQKRINHRPTRHNKKQVVCLNTCKIYSSISLASKQTGVNENSISNCCHKRQTYTITKTGEKLQWMFLDEYLKLNSETN